MTMTTSSPAAKLPTIPELRMLAHLRGGPPQDASFAAIGRAAGIPDGDNARKVFKRLEGRGWLASDPPATTDAGADVLGSTARDLGMQLPGAEPTAATPSTDVAPVAGGMIDLIPWAALEPSPGNPRNNAEAAVDDLAASIAAQGILQNLTVRPANGQAITNAGRFRIIAGERRYRAVEALIRRGTIDPSYRIPCRVIEADDLQALRLATIENVQREDLHPLEEAEAYAALIAAGDTTEDIATAVGKTRRHVQLRLALVDKLSPEVKTAFNAGEVLLAHARILSTVPAKDQNQILHNVRGGWYPTADKLKDALYRDYPSVKAAFFDVADYTGEFITDPDAKANDKAARRFADLAQFEKLQVAAIKAKAAVLAGKYAWVKIFGVGEFHAWEYEPCKDKTRAGAVIERHYDGHVSVHGGIVTKKSAEEASRMEAAGIDPATAPEKNVLPSMGLTADHRMHAKRRKTHVLQDAVASATPLVAMRLMCLAMMGGEDPCRINRGRGDGTDEINGMLSPAVAAILNGFRDGFGDAICPPHDAPEKDRGGSAGGWRDHEDGRWPLRVRHGKEAALWAFLNAMQAIDVETLFAALTARHVASWIGHDQALGDAPATAELAADLALADHEAISGLALEPDDLNGLRKPSLERIAADLGLAPPATTKATRDAILAATGYDADGTPAEQSDRAARTDYVVPSLRFGTMAALGETWDRPLPSTPAAGKAAKKAAAAMQAP